MINDNRDLGSTRCFHSRRKVEFSAWDVEGHTLHRQNIHCTPKHTYENGIYGKLAHHRAPISIAHHFHSLFLYYISLYCPLACQFKYKYRQIYIPACAATQTMPYKKEPLIAWETEPYCQQTTQQTLLHAHLLL